jgi:hypothetical protein
MTANSKLLVYSSLLLCPRVAYVEADAGDPRPERDGGQLLQDRGSDGRDTSHGIARDNRGSGSNGTESSIRHLRARE